MAAIGLQYSVYAPLTEDEVAGTFTYGTGKKGRKLIKADFKINTTDSPLYADDALSENAKEFTDGSLTVNQDELNDTMRKDLLGNSLSEITVGEETVQELTSKDTDVQPYFGYGFIQSKKVDGVRMYRAIFLTKVQFGEPDESAETKGKNISWQTPSIVGTIMRRIDGAWKQEITVPSLATAVAYIKQKANIA